MLTRKLPKQNYASTPLSLPIAALGSRSESKTTNRAAAPEAPRRVGGTGPDLSHTLPPELSIIGHTLANEPVLRCAEHHYSFLLLLLYNY